jgi:hypothetical protein
VRVGSRAISWVKTHTRAAKIGAAIVVGVLLAVHSLFVRMPAQQVDQLQMDARAAHNLEAETAARQVAVSDCLSKVEADADAQWAAACKARRQRAGCALPERQTVAFETEEHQARNSCLLRFSMSAQ